MEYFLRLSQNLDSALKNSRIGAVVASRTLVRLVPDGYRLEAALAAGLTLSCGVTQSQTVRLFVSTTDPANHLCATVEFAGGATGVVTAEATACCDSRVWILAIGRGGVFEFEDSSEPGALADPPSFLGTSIRQSLATGRTVDVSL